MTDGDRPRDAAAGAGADRQAPVPSPCNSVCRMGRDGLYCIGCFRTLEEIAGWAGFDDARRRAVWKELGLRRAQAARSPCEPRR
jgi:predicted Fe-S protein YdhL (DUF1289 family)